MSVIGIHQQLRESDKPWFIFGELPHDCGKPYSCGCPEQLVDVADADGDVYTLVPRYLAEALIARQNARPDVEED